MTSLAFNPVVSPRGVHKRVSLLSSSPRTARLPRGGLSHLKALKNGKSSNPRAMARALVEAPAPMADGGLAQAAPQWNRLPSARVPSPSVRTDTPSDLASIAARLSQRAALARMPRKLPMPGDEHSVVTARGNPYPIKMGAGGALDMATDEEGSMPTFGDYVVHIAPGGLSSPELHADYQRYIAELKRARQAYVPSGDVARRQAIGEHRKAYFPGLVPEEYRESPHKYAGDNLDPRLVPTPSAGNEFTQRILTAVNGPSFGQQMFETALGLGGVDPRDPSTTALGTGQIMNGLTKGNWWIPSVRGAGLFSMLYSPVADAPTMRKPFYNTYGKYSPYQPYGE